MSSKLEMLAAKEEELRRLNEQIEQSNKGLFAKEAPAVDDTYDISPDGTQRTGAQEESKDQVEEGERDELQPEIHETAQESYEEAMNQIDEAEFDEHLMEVQEINEVLEEKRELERTVIFQKAEIEAIQNELDGAISALNAKDIELEQMRKKDNITNKKQEKRIKTLEAEKAQLGSQLDKVQRDSKRVSQDTNVKDVRLNRVIEELEKYKIKLKEAKEEETGKNQEMREELDRVHDENRKLERQRNELLQAFKKQMKLIDILKKQKMHLEAAKMLNFTEDEFTKLLDV